MGRWFESIFLGCLILRLLYRLSRHCCSRRQSLKLGYNLPFHASHCWWTLETKKTSVSIFPLSPSFIIIICCSGMCLLLFFLVVDYLLYTYYYYYSIRN